MRHGILILTLITLISHARGDDLLLGQLTHHFVNNPTGEDFRDAHALVGLASGHGALIFMENSFNRFSAVALRMDYYELNKNYRAFTAIGVATGYSEFLPDISIGPLTPMGYVGLDLHPDSDLYGLVLTYQPHQFVGVGVRIRL